MENLLIFFILILFIALIVIKISSSLSFKKIFSFKKRTPFECGFDSISSARVPFSLQFYIIIIIFLIFDVELVLLIPIIKTCQITNLINWIITRLILLFILLLGIYFEWTRGILNWSI